MLTDQEVFDKVCKHLSEQKERAVNEKLNCKYITGDGKKCAVGCLLSDEELEKIGNYQGGVAKLFRDFPGQIETLDPEKSEFLNELQMAHDHSYGPIELKRRLKHITAVFNLKPEAINLITEWEGTKLEEVSK